MLPTQPTQEEINLALERARQARAQAAANILQKSLSYLTQTNGNVYTRVLTGVVAAGSAGYLVWLFLN